MSTPERIRNYTFSVNNRIAYSSLNQVMSEYLYGIKNFLVATMGYTVKYSCDGTTGPSSGSDHTDRWTNATKAATRGANTSTAQSWIVLTDGDGVDFMLSYTGATDDVGRYAFSQGALYTPAGTATFPATATDEFQTSGGSTSWIESTASQDRVFHLMATANKKNWRAFICRNGKATGSYLGLETYQSNLVSPAVQAINKCALNQLASNLATSNIFAATHVFARVAMASVGTSVSCAYGMEFSTPTTVTTYDGINLELQGSIGAAVRGLSVWSTTASARGKLGNLIDLWHSAEQQPDGAVTVDKKWIMISGTVSNSGAAIWPWDGTSEPQFS